MERSWTTFGGNYVRNRWSFHCRFACPSINVPTLLRCGSRFRYRWRIKKWWIRSIRYIWVHYPITIRLHDRGLRPTKVRALPMLLSPPSRSHTTICMHVYSFGCRLEYIWKTETTSATTGNGYVTLLWDDVRSCKKHVGIHSKRKSEQLRQRFNLV